MNKKFPIKGHCLSTNKIIVKYLQDNFEKIVGNTYSKKSTGVAWNENRWWYINNQSSTPKYDPHVIINIITEINGMNNPSIVTGTVTGTGTGTLITSSELMPGSSICTTTTTTAPIYNPNEYLPNNVWVYRGADISIGTGTITVTNLVTEPTKLRIKCQNLKKNLKVSLLQINLK